MMLLPVALLLLVFSLSPADAAAVVVKYPVILVPGLGGSQIEAKITRNHSDHWYCPKRTGWHTIWGSLGYMTPFAVNCLYDNFRYAITAA